ncbi:hypothetical protein [Prosthecobacter sp.]|nr:hypothetical protein [Prosthecobacter sp.]MDZ4404892.1 hypothetical protein [Prosthecobacter sp.]
MKTPAASTTRRTQGLTSGGFFASIGALIQNPFFRERPRFTLPQPG